MSATGETVLIRGENELNAFLKKHATVAILLFGGAWSDTEASTLASLKEMILEPGMPSDVGLASIEAEEVPEISLKYNITGVPTTLLFHEGKEVFRVSGLRFRDLASKVIYYGNNSGAAPPAESAPTSTMDLTDRIKKLLGQADVMLFMKGNPAEPQCGFSRTIVGILNETGVPYSTFNILADNDIREGLKTFSNWRTYPQLYVKSQLIGGLDIVKELKESGDLMDTLNG